MHTHPMARKPTSAPPALPALGDEDARWIEAWASADPTRRLGLQLWRLRASPTRERFDEVCAAATELLGQHRPRGFLGLRRDRRHGRIAAATLRWWLYAACPTCRGWGSAAAECPSCRGSGRLPMDRSLAADLEAAQWLARQLDAASATMAAGYLAAHEGDGSP